MGERDSSRKILAFIPLPPFLCLHPRIQDDESRHSVSLCLSHSVSDGDGNQKKLAKAEGFVVPV